MKPYVRTYLTYFGLGFHPDNFVPCECCGAKASDIHHLSPRSLRKDLVNKIENLMALCREHHDRAGKDREFNESLRLIHRKRLLANGLPDNETEKYLQEP